MRGMSAADERRHLAGIWQEMNFPEKRLSELRGVVGSVHPVGAAKTPEAAASRNLQSAR